MPAAATNRQSADIFVDAHVHIYPFMSVEVLLDAARRNLFDNGERAADGDSSGLLLVADPDGVRGFERLLAFAEGASSADGGGDWVCEHADSRSVTFRRSCGLRIIAVRGQQLISLEGLEVLGVGYDGDMPSGLSLRQTVARIRAAGGWSIIAWGVGKWLGRRGRIVTNLIIEESGHPDIMLADNGGRPWCWSRVPQFATATERGMRILAGTDPLPLQGEERRVGSYGFRVEVECAEGRAIVDSFRRALERPETPVQTTGALMPVSHFVSNQLRLRLRSTSPARRA